MSELVLLLAVVLGLAGVVGSVVPMVPGAPLSLLGVGLYWWTSGFSEPGLLSIVVITVIGFTAVLTDTFAGAIAAKFGGASWLTTTLAGIVGFVLFFVTGPLGMLLGIALTVFGGEIYRHRDARAGARTALVATVGVIGSAAMQFVLTLSILFIFLASVL
ncbi:DUF456 domain-containing protein [Halocatena halophila]|uniref:DUF456 domain-containing protein n=1 Tax=Halocatena halophila TaxID=2814576 RepID=UPI002ED271C3